MKKPSRAGGFPEYLELLDKSCENNYQDWIVA